jgi:hypothetical protein
MLIKNLLMLTRLLMHFLVNGKEEHMMMFYLIKLSQLEPTVSSKTSSAIDFINFHNNRNFLSLF